MAKSHILSDISIENQTANCSICGLVTIYHYQTQNWYCGRVLAKRVVHTHVLSSICEKSRTAFCKGCGLVGIIYHDNSGCWRCNRKVKGKADRKKELHRKNKKGLCEQCGFVPIHSKQLDIHHKDGNHFNDVPENMETICANCHRLEHIQTYEELDEIRQKGLIERREDVQKNPHNYSKDIELENIGLGHKNTIKLSHKLTKICPYSRTAYCQRCGLVSINIRIDKSDIKYWDCNHGGRKSGYGKDSSRKKSLEQRFFRENKKACCDKCGFIPTNDRQMDIHHKDHDHDNNEKSNLETLCANCHRLAHVKSEDKLTLERHAELLQKRWTELLNDPQYHLPKQEEQIIIGITIP